MRKTEFADNCYYHIYNRGVDKRKIFIHTHDYLRFVMALYLFNNSEPVDIANIPKVTPSSEGVTFGNHHRREIVDIGAYCLMPNHFHLLIKSRDAKSLIIFMRKLGTGYAMYFNKKYKRTGRLFENAFKATLIEDDEYLRHSSIYIHMNPLKLSDSQWKENGVSDIRSAHKFLEGYQWSSYQHYLGEKKDNILNLDVFPKYFENSNAYKMFIEDWMLNYRYKNPPKV